MSVALNFLSFHPTTSVTNWIEGGAEQNGKEPTSDKKLVDGNHSGQCIAKKKTGAPIQNSICSGYSDKAKWEIKFTPAFPSSLCVNDRDSPTTASLSWIITYFPSSFCVNDQDSTASVSLRTDGKG